MSDINTTKNPGDGEIDLLDLFRRAGMAIASLFKSLSKGFLISFVFLMRRWLPLGLSIIAGAVLSFLLKVSSDSFYTSDMTLKTNGATAAEVIGYLSRLHTYCLEGNKTALNEALSVNTATVDVINDINAFWIIDKNKDMIPDFVDYKNNHDVYDTTNIRMPDRLNVRVNIKAPQELSTVQKGIVDFIERDSLFRQKNRLRNNQNSEMLERLDYDILQLDSLQKVKYFEETRNRKPQNGGQMIFLQEQNTQLVFRDIHELYARKQYLEAERDIYKDIVTVTSNFSLPAKRENGLIYYAKLLIPACFILMLIVLIFISNRRKLEEVFNKY